MGDDRMVNAQDRPQKVKLLDSDLPKVVMAGPLSRDTTFALHITGPYRPAEVEKLIQMLQMQKVWLVEDESSNSNLTNG